MVMVNVVTIAAYRQIYWLKVNRRPPGTSCYIHQMNHVNSRSGSVMITIPQT